jgi:hypothetical protein
MTTPADLITVIQASTFRAESGSPLSENAIREAVTAGKLNRYSLPVTGAKLLVSRAEVAAYQPTGHKPKGYKHEKREPEPVRSSDDDPNDRNGQPWAPWNPYK